MEQDYDNDIFHDVAGYTEHYDEYPEGKNFLIAAATAVVGVAAFFISVAFCA